MAKAKNPYADYEFIRAYQDTVVDLREQHQVHVVTAVNLYSGRGCITLSLTAYDSRLGRGEARLAHYEVSWPNAHEQSFAAALYMAAMRLHGLATESLASNLWSEPAA